MKLQNAIKRSISEDMSEDERDIDIESDDYDSDNPRSSSKNPNHSQAEKRAHHNALERKRRDHIKDSFTNLREAVPSLQGEKASRAQILKKAAEYISSMRRKSVLQSKDIDDLKQQNATIENQIRQLERARDSYNGNDGELGGGNNNHGAAGGAHHHEGEEDSSEETNSMNGGGGAYARRTKKMKTNGNY